MTIKYQVKKIVEIEKSTIIENENFIAVEHSENGIIMYTAFIGKGENNNDKKSIKVSPSGGILEIKRMAGNALLNAEILLRQNSFNKVIKNSDFLTLYLREKTRLVIDFNPDKSLKEKKSY